jgi:hypothetical protein
MREIGTKQHQVPRPVLTKTIRHHPLTLAVDNECKFKFGMVVPIEGKNAFDSLVSSEAAKCFPDFFKPGQHKPDINTVSSIVARTF